MNILLLAGTAEARDLAGRMVAAGHAVTASLAGVTAKPLPLPCPVVTGGFGGASGLARYLRAHRIEVLVDATHPFAVRIQAAAREAAAGAGIRLMRLHRPGWVAEPGWTLVPDLAAAAAALPAGGRVVLTTGRQGLAAFAGRGDVWFLIRSLTPMPCPLAQGTVVTGRPPFSLATELALMQAHRIDTLVSKDSGGAREKLDAARQLGLQVVMVTRPETGALGLAVEEILIKLNQSG